MVETNIRNDAHFRHNNIGTIESSTQAHFNDGDVNVHVFEIIKSHSGGYLKE